VRVTAPPVDSAANDATRAALADAFELPERSVTIVAGATSRNKTVEVRGLTDAQLVDRLATLGTRVRASGPNGS